MEIGVPGITEAQKIGEGAFGVVYKARQESFNRLVAVKVLANVDLTEEANKRFAREVSAVGRLSGHPNIVNVFEHGVTEGGAPYLVMEFCPGGSYGDALKRGHRYPWDEATDVAVSIAGALESSHRAGIVHRDVKPDNILIDGYGVPKLADLGVARAGAQTAMTAAGSLVGSLAFIAPEMVIGEEPSPASDMYALAATTHALITGEPPFVRHTDTSIAPLLLRIAHDTPPRLPEHDAPAPVADVVERAMAKNPAERPATCAEFAEQLRTARHSVGVAASSYQVVRPAGTSGGPAADETNIGPAGIGAAASAPTPNWPGASGPTHPWPGASGPTPHWAGASGPTPSDGPSGPTPHWAGTSGPIPSGGTPSGGYPYPHPDSLTQTQPSQGSEKRSRRGLFIGLSVAAAILAVVAAFVGVRVFTGEAPPPVDRTPALTDRQAAEGIRLTTADVNDAGGDWQLYEGPDIMSPTFGYCQSVLETLPVEYQQRAFDPVEPLEVGLLQLGSAGAVFESSRAAESYLREWKASAECGESTTPQTTETVTPSSFSPTLVGCRCQNVAVFEATVTYTDGTPPQTVVALQAQQDKYVADAFVNLPTDVLQEDEARRFIGEVFDTVIKKLSNVADDATGAGS